MKVRVKLFAAAKELAGGESVTVELPEGATLAMLRQEVSASFPKLQAILPHSMWAIDAAYAADATLIAESSEVALIPPVSGG